jgi:hypothetical protein
MMVNALVLFQTDGFVSDEIQEGLRSKSLSNAKQILVGRVRHQLILDVAANTIADLNRAVTELGGLFPAVRSATIVHMANS